MSALDLVPLPPQGLLHIIELALVLQDALLHLRNGGSDLLFDGFLVGCVLDLLFLVQPLFQFLQLGLLALLQGLEFGVHQ